MSYIILIANDHKLGVMFTSYFASTKSFLLCDFISINTNYFYLIKTTHLYRYHKKLLKQYILVI